MDTPLLWHIPLSHFNEKVRWTLDYKRIAHRRRVLGADYLIRAWRATGRGTLPILFLDGRAIGDSTHIIAALEERYPETPLYPGDADARQRALALEDYFDEQLRPALRAAVITPLFRHDPDLALRVLTTGMPDKAYQTLRPLVRIFPAFYRFRHKISDAKLEADRATVNAALDRIEQERQGRAYLILNVIRAERRRRISSLRGDVMAKAFFLARRRCEGAPAGFSTERIEHKSGADGRI